MFDKYKVSIKIFEIWTDVRSSLRLNTRPFRLALCVYPAIQVRIQLAGDLIHALASAADATRRLGD